MPVLTLFAAGNFLFAVNCIRHCLVALTRSNQLDVVIIRNLAENYDRYCVYGWNFGY
jgi:hypothetical protein